MLLHAFVTHNERYALRLSMRMLADADPSGLQGLLPSYAPARCADGLRVLAGDRGHTPVTAYLKVKEPDLRRRGSAVTATGRRRAHGARVGG